MILAMLMKMCRNIPKYVHTVLLILSMGGPNQISKDVIVLVPVIVIDLGFPALVAHERKCN